MIRLQIAIRLCRRLFRARARAPLRVLEQFRDRPESAFREGGIRRELRALRGARLDCERPSLSSFKGCPAAARLYSCEVSSLGRGRWCHVQEAAAAVTDHVHQGE